MTALKNRQLETTKRIMESKILVPSETLLHLDLILYRKVHHQTLFHANQQISTKLF